VPEAHAAAVTRAAEEALRGTSALALQPALATGLAVKKRCGAVDPGCWNELAAQAGTDYALVMVASGTGGLTVDLALVDLKGHQVAVRRFTATGVDGASRAAREVVEALVPAHLRRGFGGLEASLPPGGRWKVDGQVVQAEPSRGPLALRSGRHEVDLLLPDGSAVLSRADVVEGQVAALQFDSRPPAAGRSSDALMATSAALWSAGTVAVVTSLALATLVNVRAGANLRPCAAGASDCLTLDGAIAEQQVEAGFTGTANVLLWTGSALALAGVGVFTFDLVQGKQ